MTTLTRASAAVCPECQARLRFHKDLRMGQLISCPECDETLEVISLRPLELYWADEEPWTDLNDDYEDYDDFQDLSPYR